MIKRDRQTDIQTKSEWVRDRHTDGERHTDSYRYREMDRDRQPERDIHTDRRRERLASR